ncbi:hypothetical protein [Spirosoma endophyticum]|uniref:Uncharacterized protein n=1 Tax=Spirosoma endophyticum TaxID=662367 RepID=A0A1I1UAN5_9BACT|nr:hypothetical protein [Spirosoma endophyticum]SFD67892.1 hypothetical protein SAMN05216167_106195 [Spirosoma endophyticum]
MITQDNISIAQRLVAPKPKIFSILQKVGFGLAAVGATLLTGGGILPIIGGYIITAGAVASTVSQVAVDFKKLEEQQGNK